MSDLPAPGADHKREVTQRLGIADKTVGGLGGGHIKIRYYEDSGLIDFEVSKQGLVLSHAEAVMVAKYLLCAAQPHEEDFWPDGASS